MKRTALLVALLTAVIVCSLSLSTPRPALAALLCCDNGGYQTSQYFVMASTCSQANSNYRSLAFPEAADVCGGSTRVCGFTMPPCYYNTDFGAYIVNGLATFGCKEDCGPILP